MKYFSGSYRDYEDVSPNPWRDIIGRVIKDVVKLNGGNQILFTFQDGSSQRFETTGDCCSNSWVEHLEKPADVDGAKLLSIEDGEFVSQQDGELKIYHTVFKTDRGDIVCEYRNSSNGYYGGDMEAVLED